jgi:hypothetical protein
MVLDDKIRIHKNNADSDVFHAILINESMAIHEIGHWVAVRAKLVSRPPIYC